MKKLSRKIKRSPVSFGYVEKKTKKHGSCLVVRYYPEEVGMNKECWRCQVCGKEFVKLNKEKG